MEGGGGERMTDICGGAGQIKHPRPIGQFLGHVTSLECE